MRQAAFFQSLKFASAGVVTLLRTQRNARIHLVVASVVVAAGLGLQVERWEWAMLIVAIGIVLICEAFNTAIEAVVDLASPEFHELARTAKDVSAGAVLLAALTSVVIGLLILGPPLWDIIEPIL